MLLFIRWIDLLIGKAFTCEWMLLRVLHNHNLVLSLGIPDSSKDIAVYSRTLKSVTSIPNISRFYAWLRHHFTQSWSQITATTSGISRHGSNSTPLIIRSRSVVMVCDDSPSLIEAVFPEYLFECKGHLTWQQRRGKADQEVCDSKAVSAPPTACSATQTSGNLRPLSHQRSPLLADRLRGYRLISLNYNSKNQEEVWWSACITAWVGWNSSRAQE